MQTQALEIISTEHDTEPALPIVRRGSICGMDGCYQAATEHRCAFCRMPLCEEHKLSRSINGEKHVACPHHARGR